MSEREPQPPELATLSDEEQEQFVEDFVAEVVEAVNDPNTVLAGITSDGEFTPLDGYRALAYQYNHDLEEGLKIGARDTFLTSLAWFANEYEIPIKESTKIQVEASRQALERKQGFGHSHPESE